MPKNLELFSSASGKINLHDAINGDEKSVRYALPWMALRIERGEPLEEAERLWLGNALMRISFGVKPDDAFFGKSKKGGKSRPKHWERWVAFSMLELMQDGSNKKDAAAAIREKAISDFKAGGFIFYAASETQVRCTVDTYELIYDTHEKWARDSIGSRVHKMRR